MKMIITLEDISIWKLLFIMGFFALLIFVLVRAAPSAETQSGGTLPMLSYQDSFCLR
jgi:hypothetical protein